MIVKAYKYREVSPTHGYAVEKLKDLYAISFVRKLDDGTLIREGYSKSLGKLLAYKSPFIADHVIRTQLLPLYK